MFKKIWRDPVGSNAIGSIIAAAFIAFVSYLALHFFRITKAFLESTANVPNWLLVSILVPVIAAYALLAEARRRKGIPDRSSPPPSLASPPQIEIRHHPESPYEITEIQRHHVLSTVRIGITNLGGRPLSNCKVYVEKIAPDPSISLPILLDGAGFMLRHDDPEKLVDIAAQWDHIDKFRFSAPLGGGFADAASYIASGQARTITIKVIAVECQRSASFKLWTDAEKAMHLEFLGYGS